MNNKVLIVIIAILSCLLIGLSGVTYFMNKNKNVSNDTNIPVNNQENSDANEPKEETKKENDIDVSQIDYTVLNGTIGYQASGENATIITFDFTNNGVEDIPINKIKFEITDKTNKDNILTYEQELNKKYSPNESEHIEFDKDIKMENIENMLIYYE